MSGHIAVDAAYSNLTMIHPVKERAAMSLGKQCVAVFVISWIPLVSLADPPLSPTDVDATPITIHAKNAYEPQVLAQLAGQSGMKITADPYWPALFNFDGKNTLMEGDAGYWPAVSVQADHEPFWSVLCQICNTGHSGFYLSYPSDGSLAVARYGALPLAYAVSGPVLVEVEKVEPVKGAADPRDAELCMRCLWEPRLDVVCRNSFSVPTEAVDEHGVSRLAPSPKEAPFFAYRVQPVHETWPENGCGFLYRVPLRLPADGKGRLATVKGVVRIWLATRWETVEADYPKTMNSPPTVARLSDGHCVTITNPQDVNADTLCMRLELSRENLADERWQSYKHLLGAAVAAGKVTVRDSQGRAWGTSTHYVGLDSDGLEGDNEVENTATPYVTYDRPAGVGPAVKVTIQFPIEQTEIDAAYEIHDVPLRQTP
jgi:hypothetical protein